MLEYTVAADHFNYIESGVSGPDDSYRLSGLVGHTMPFGTLLGARGVFESQIHNVVYNVGSYEALAADGQLLTGEVFLQMAPFSWVTAEIGQSMQSASWDVIEPKEAQDVYERNQPSLLTEFRASIVLNLLF